MKANEYIKKYGIDEARKFLEVPSYSIDQLMMLKSGVDVREIERLVESHDLLDEIDGIDGARDRIYICEIDDCTSFSLGGYVYEISQVKQAIADVESCQ
ncbi:hypothetical protein [Acinetobacter rathckeae]|uniref:hypothetical protein n=1 Tax=Acinetobacter rathckeae TaxID=2605272 RepID=UPI0018A2EE31|nr:hypothetical protein [Acinetobacter rathckeae]MBF7687058.1 hypothetical protein [Acinetobacter rathckeae]